MTLKNSWSFLKQTFSDWKEDKAARLAAALAYYTVFSIAPLFIIAIAIAGMFFGHEAAQGRIYEQISSLIGSDAGKTIQDMIAHSRSHKSGLISTVLGVATLLFGAGGVFIELQDSLNTIWEVKPKPGTGLLGFIRERLLSFTMVLGIGFLLLVSLVLSAGIAAFSGLINSMLPSLEVLAHITSALISFAIITFLFAMIFKFLPDVEITWRDVWVGAAATSLLFSIGKTLIGLYLGKSAVSSTYGAAGALVILLIWVYYSSQILFLGAEFTQVYAGRFGSRIVPAENAEPMTEEARAQQGIPKDQEREAAAPRPHPQKLPDRRPAARRLSPVHRPALSRGSVLFGLLLGALFAMLRGHRSRV